jgi:hypothetical protein
MLLIAIAFNSKNSNYYKEAVKLNKNLKADGIELMMPLDAVRNIFGKEEVYNKGFGGDFFQYPSKGVAFSVSLDTSYDLYNRIVDLRITNPNYSVFGISCGISAIDAWKVLESIGYEKDTELYTDTSYSKGCIVLSLVTSENKINEIKIYVKDKKFDSDKVY